MIIGLAFSLRIDAPCNHFNFFAFILSGGMDSDASKVSNGVHASSFCEEARKVFIGALPFLATESICYFLTFHFKKCTIEQQ